MCSIDFQYLYLLAIFHQQETTENGKPDRSFLHYGTLSPHMATRWPLGVHGDLQSLCQCSAWQAALALSQSATSEDPMIRYAAAIGASEKASNWKLGRKFENCCSCYFHFFFLEGTKVSATIGPYFICFFFLAIDWNHCVEKILARYMRQICSWSDPSFCMYNREWLYKYTRSCFISLFFSS